jgi:hypothetical protein
MFSLHRPDGLRAAGAVPALATISCVGTPGRAGVVCVAAKGPAVLLAFAPRRDVRQHAFLSTMRIASLWVPFLFMLQKH